MSVHSHIHSIIKRNEEWLFEFNLYAKKQKEPLLYVDMQSPSVNQLFQELEKRLDTEKNVFMYNKMLENVKDMVTEKKMLESYQQIILSASKSLNSKKSSESFAPNLPCFSKKECKIDIDPMHYIDRINAQLPYYDV
jgi:hypothetical protein